MQKKKLESYSTEEKMELFDQIYKLMNDHYESYKGGHHTEEDEEGFRMELVNLATELVYPGCTEEEVFEALSDDEYKESFVADEEDDEEFQGKIIISDDEDFDLD